MIYFFQNLRFIIENMELSEINLETKDLKSYKSPSSTPNNYAMRTTGITNYNTNGLYQDVK